jgi:HEPN domain-containing protein
MCSPTDRPSLWSDWLRANKIRRNVVHEGARATERDARRVVETVEAVIQFVEKNRSQ